jgi:multidrug transporter EmrE-like cation transporter
MYRWLIPLILLVVFEACADIIAKYFAITNKMWIGIGALGVYIIANIFWLISLRNGAELATGAVIFSVISQILAILIGVLIYHEQLSLTQGAGIILGLVSLALLVWE